MVDIRHDLHAHPELAFEEYRTTQVIRDRLERPRTGSSTVARPTPVPSPSCDGAKPGKTSHDSRRHRRPARPRGEFDSRYASSNEGVMHACGHDVHTAALLGVADVLSRRRDELAGEFTLLFQPAEEGLGGAQRQ